MRKQRCSEHPDQLYDLSSEELCLKCRIESLQRRVKELEDKLLQLSAGEQVVVALGYPFYDLLRPIFEALKFRRADYTIRGKHKRLQVGSTTSSSYEYLVPEGVAKAVESVLEEVVKGIRSEVKASIHYGLQELSEKANEKIQEFFFAETAEKQALSRIDEMNQVRAKWTKGEKE